MSKSSAKAFLRVVHFLRRQRRKNKTSAENFLKLSLIKDIKNFNKLMIGFNIQVYELSAPECKVFYPFRSFSSAQDNYLCHLIFLFFAFKKTILVTLQNVLKIEEPQDNVSFKNGRSDRQLDVTVVLKTFRTKTLVYSELVKAL
jgi:hypothetical protein